MDFEALKREEGSRRLTPSIGWKASAREIRRELHSPPRVTSE